MRHRSLLTAAALVAALATPAYAGFIYGDIEVDGTFSRLPDVGNSSIVSDLRYLSVDHAATIAFSTGTGWFANLDPATRAVANNINLEGPIHFTYTVGDFRFLATSISNIIRSTPVCTDTTCTDSLAFEIAGVISAPGGSTTAFTGTWRGFGSCYAVHGVCASRVTGRWNVYLDPPVAAATVPEPGSVVLLGLGFGVLGLVMRRRRR
jgi:PEP-CTERM motif